jgi:3-hydroxypropanoate dehydrogenase
MNEDDRILDDASLDILFREARTFSKWKKEQVSDVLIQAIYDLMKWGPTSANCCPMRVIFVKSQEAKERLKPHIMKGNVEQTMSAPATAIIANDLSFYDHLPKLSASPDAKSWFEGKPKLIEETAMRNGSLQGAYFMIAARSLGLDCGPMSGFSKKGIKNEFLADENVEINFLCNIGYGEDGSPYPRGPRFEFDEVCEII